MLFEQHPLLGECVNVGRAEIGLAINTQITVAEVIRDDEDHIGFGCGVAELRQENQGEDDQLFHLENRF